MLNFDSLCTTAGVLSKILKIFYGGCTQIHHPQGLRLYAIIYKDQCGIKSDNGFHAKDDQIFYYRTASSVPFGHPIISQSTSFINSKFYYLGEELPEVDVKEDYFSLSTLYSDEVLQQLYVLQILHQMNPQLLTISFVSDSLKLFLPLQAAYEEVLC